MLVSPVINSYPTLLRVTFFVFFSHLTGCYNAIKPCVTVCEAIFRTFCNQFFCSERLKIDNRMECPRACLSEFRAADPNYIDRYKELRMGSNNTYEYYDIEYSTNKSPSPYDFKSPSGDTFDAYYENLKSAMLLYRKMDYDNGQDYLIDIMDDDEPNRLHFATAEGLTFEASEPFFEPASRQQSLTTSSTID